MNLRTSAIIGSLILSATAQQAPTAPPAKPIRIANLAACPEPVR